MPKIDLRKGESLEGALRKFKMKMRQERTIEEIRKREFYEKPSERRRRKKEAARRKETRRRLEQE